jgi:hypothetical protein
MENRIVYRNKFTNDLVIKKGDKMYFFSDKNNISEETIRKEIVQNGSDWVLVIPEREAYKIQLDKDGKIYFRNIINNNCYYINDNFTIPSTCSFGDGKRNFIIENFHISDMEHMKDNRFEYVYVKTKCGRDIHLNDVINHN